MSNPEIKNVEDLKLAIENLSPDEKKAFALCMSQRPLISVVNGLAYAVTVGFVPYIFRPFRKYTKPVAVVAGIFGFLVSRASVPVHCLKQIKTNDEWRERYLNKFNETYNISPPNKDQAVPPSEFVDAADSSETYSSETSDVFADGYEDLSEPVKSQPITSYADLRQRNRADYQRKYERYNEPKRDTAYTWDSRSNQSAAPAEEEKKSDRSESETSRKETTLYGDVWG